MEAQKFYSHLKDTSDLGLTLRVLRPKGFSWAHVQQASGSKVECQGRVEEKHTAWGTLAALRLRSAQCLHSKESVLHRSVSVSFPFLYLLHLSVVICVIRFSEISLSLSLGPLAVGVWSTMADGTINLPDDLLSSKAPEEHWTDKGIFRDLNSYVPFLWALFR